MGNNMVALMYFVYVDKIKQSKTAFDHFPKKSTWIVLKKQVLLVWPNLVFTFAEIRKWPLIFCCMVHICYLIPAQPIPKLWKWQPKLFVIRSRLPITIDAFQDFPIKYKVFSILCILWEKVAGNYWIGMIGVWFFVIIEFWSKVGVGKLVPLSILWNVVTYSIKFLCDFDF